MRAGRTRPDMLDLVLGGATALALAAYLVAALVHPERF
ncbi:K(+)-transporting ATPase subunit F [Aureimonas endophytica]|nr:K(+)-transporting ATPase subunit F [Aureimonas endophytica]